MTDARYDLYLSGELALGCDREAALRQLSALFKRPPEQVQKLLAGKATRIRKALSEDELNRYQQGFDKLGILTEARLCEPEKTQDRTAAAIAEHAAAASSEPLALTPVGTPVLRQQERPAQAKANIDVPDLSLSSVGSQLSESRPTTAIAPDTSHLSVAEAGADLGGQHQSVERDLDAMTAKLSVAEVGTPLREAKAPAPVSAPNTSHLALKDG
ncbi:hypothetical protein I6N98_11135 [Spongiibacter nanhainus]|uniref:Uncharacterized protein n=1 Tax=Spongiibacter nanhainus TaxID=2794344 RepID=A0A7T4QYB5_9GAMM|nr:hypothetical protein [Spongiibacter nanhainus]QQD16936.1 hypothetical protein I6N98_11135 [Spongiibacter nanhainus]